MDKRLREGQETRERGAGTQKRDVRDQREKQRSRERGAETQDGMPEIGRGYINPRGVGHKNLGRGQKIRRGVNRDSGGTLTQRERERQKVGWRADAQSDGKIVESCGWGTVWVTEMREGDP